MTCEEYRHTIDTVFVMTATRGLRASLVAHCNSCVSCQEWTKRGEEEYLNYVTPEQDVEITEASKALRTRDMQDPEYVEVVRKKEEE